MNEPRKTWMDPEISLDEGTQEQSIAAAEHGIELFSDYVSVFTPLSPDALLQHVAVCRNAVDERGVDCRVKLIEALYFSSHVELAKQEHQKLLEDAGARIHPAIKAYLASLLAT